MSGNDDIAASLLRYRDETPDFQRGFDAGWEAAYRELSQQDEDRIPPLLRRFFWYSRARYERDDRVPLIQRTGTDEWCNPVLSMRLFNGVLHIRYGRKLRGPKDGPCSDCANLTLKEKA